MKVLYLIKQEPDGTVRALMDEHRKEHTVTVVDLREERDYAGIVDLIEENDRVISW